MLREHRYILRQVNFAVDFCIGGASFFLAHAARHALSAYVAPQWIAPSRISDYGAMPFLLPFLTVAVMGYNGFYQSQRLRSGSFDLARQVAVCCLQITALLMAAIYVFWNGDIVSRPLLMLIPAVLFGLLMAKNAVIRRILRAIRGRGLNYRSVILVGSGEPLERFIRQLEEHAFWGLKITGVITDQPGPAPSAGETVHGYPLLAALEGGADAVFHARVDEVVLVPHSAPLESLVPLMEACEEMGVRTHLTLQYFLGGIARPVLDRFDEIPVVSYWPTREIGPALLFKSVFDRIAGAAFILLFSPVFLTVMLLIRLTSKRGEPIFFGQTRLGLNGRPFTCWKFRTMHVDAEARKKELEKLNEMQGGPVFKIKNDPRITAVGKYLRKTSLDELPQFYNVLIGDMSIVGPRPPIPDEVKKYDRWQRRRLSMKPGITCLWQVMGRNRLSFDTWMKLDLQYIDNWSLGLDFRIMLRTVYVVVTGDGAM